MPVLGVVSAADAFLDCLIVVGVNTIDTTPCVGDAGVVGAILQRI